MNTKENRKNELAALDKLINEITVDAYGDNEQLWHFGRLSRAMLSLSLAP